MSIASVIKPYTFANNTETADGTKVNQNFDVLYAVINALISDFNSTGGSRSSLLARLAVSLNDDGTIKGSALPVGTYDVRRTRTIDAADDMAADDSMILVDTTAGDVALTLLSAAVIHVSPTIVNIGLTGHNVVITPAGGEKIMGLDTYELTVGGESVRLSPDGAGNWWRSG